MALGVCERISRLLRASIRGLRRAFSAPPPRRTERYASVAVASEGSGSARVSAPSRRRDIPSQTPGREAHDALLAVLADGPRRTALLAGDDLPALRGALRDPVLRERLVRLARFFGRHYFRERIVRLCRHTRALRRFTGADPLAVLGTADFTAFLDHAVLGGAESAAEIARRVEAALAPEDPARLAVVPYWRDLVRYDVSLLRLEAGPRTWAASPPPGPDARPRQAASLATLAFEWDLLAVLPALRREPARVPPAERRAVRAIVARSPRGRMTVVVETPDLARLLTALDGRTVEDAARAVAAPVAETRALVERLVALGAVEWT